MPNSTKRHAFTSKLSYSSDGGSTYTDLADMKLITPPDLDKGDGKVTSLDSPNKTHEYIAGWRELGEMAFEMWFSNAQLTTVLGFWNSDTIYYWKVTLPKIGAEVNPPTLVGQGYLKKVKLSELSIESDDGISCPASIKLATGTGFAFSAAS